MSQIKVLGDAAWFEPDEGVGNAFQEPGGDALPVGGREFCAIETDDEQVEEVVFAFELVAVVTDGASVGVGFGAYGEEGDGFAGLADAGLEGWEEDPVVSPDVVENLGHDAAPLGGFLGGGVEPVAHKAGECSGGAGGIRTHERGLPFTRFPIALLRPLGHHSADGLFWAILAGGVRSERSLGS